MGRAAKPRGFAGKLRSDAPVPEKKGGRRARSGPAAGTQPSKGKLEHPVGVRKRAQQSIKHIVARARRKEGECAQQRQVRDGESRVKAGTAPEGNTCKGNVLVLLEATADRLQGSVSGSNWAREAKRPQPQGKQEPKCDSSGEPGG